MVWFFPHRSLTTDYYCQCVCARAHKITYLKLRLIQCWKSVYHLFYMFLISKRLQSHASKFLFTLNFTDTRSGYKNAAVPRIIWLFLFEMCFTFPTKNYGFQLHLHENINLTTSTALTSLSSKMKKHPMKVRWVSLNIIYDKDVLVKVKVPRYRPGQAPGVPGG